MPSALWHSIPSCWELFINHCPEIFFRRLCEKKRYFHSHRVYLSMWGDWTWGCGGCGGWEGGRVRRRRWRGLPKVLAVSIRDRPGFNTKSILLQSAITVCWLKQMAAMNGTPRPVSVAEWPQKRCFMWGGFLRLSALSLAHSLSFSLSKAVHVHHSILSLFLHILLFGFKLSLFHGHMRVCVVLVQYLYMRNE